jgi:hypothetical protein
LTLHERVKLATRETFGPAAYIYPAINAGVTMAHPPSHFSREWSDGGAAFGRNYGSNLERHTAGGLTKFAIAAVDGEDPRYFPSTSTHMVPRFVHAALFTVVDRSNSGHRTIAFSNLGGAAAAGFSGMPFQPDGFDDAPHAEQRAAVEVGSFALHNVVIEFSPEFLALARKMHIPMRLARIAITEDRNDPNHP